MKNKMFLFCHRLSPALSPAKELKIVEPSCPEVSDDVRQLLDYIFGTDPNTGLPTGDLAIYLGKDSNPQVRDFIERNLMIENPSNKGSFDLPTDVVNRFRSVITDDDIAFFSRNGNETREEYSDRLKLYFKNERELRVKNSRNQKLKELYEKSIKALS